MNNGLIFGRITKGIQEIKKEPEKEEIKKEKEKISFKKGDLVYSKVLGNASFANKEKRVGKIIYIEEDKRKNYNKYSGQAEPYQVEWGDGTVFSYAENELGKMKGK